MRCSSNIWRVFRRIRGEINTFFVGFAIAMAIYVLWELGIDGLLTGAVIAAIVGFLGNIGYFFYKRRDPDPTDVSNARQ